MSQTEDQDNRIREKGLTDHLSVFWRWKVFIIVVMLIATGIAFAVAFLIPPTYKSTATVFIPPENSGSFGGLTSLLSSKSSASLGAKLFGVTNTSEDMLLGILYSRSALVEVINRFNLVSYYKVKDRNIDKTLKYFLSDISFGPNEHGMIEISIINENPVVAADIANYFTILVDSVNRKFNGEQARNYRMFVEKRYNKNLEDLKSAEEAMQRFQQQYGVFAVPQQFEVAVKAAAELEAQLMGKEIAAQFIKQQYGENSPPYLGAMAEINLLRQKVTELKRSDKLSSESNVLFPFKNAPKMSIEYIRYYREVEIQTKILEIVMPLFEQAKIDEQKSMPAVMTLDKAVPAELKYAPKRGLIILGITFLAFLLCLIGTMIMDIFRKNENVHNAFGQFLFVNSSFWARLFRIKD